jgi:hypothetical protein
MSETKIAILESESEVEMPASILSLVKDAECAAKEKSSGSSQNDYLTTWLDYKDLQVLLQGLLKSAEGGDEDAVRDRDDEFLSLAEFLEEFIADDLEEMTLAISAKDAMSVIRELEGGGTFDVTDLSGCGSDGAGRIAHVMLDAFIRHILEVTGELALQEYDNA